MSTPQQSRRLRRIAPHSGWLKTCIPHGAFPMIFLYPRLTMAGLALAAGLVVGPLAAQEAAPAVQPAVPAAPAVPDPNKVIATIDGVTITEADLTLAETDLDQQFAQLPPEQRRAAALSAIIEIRVLAAKA